MVLSNSGADSVLPIPGLIPRSEHISVSANVIPTLEEFSMRQVLRRKSRSYYCLSIGTMKFYSVFALCLLFVGGGMPVRTSAKLDSSREAIGDRDIRSPWTASWFGLGQGGDEFEQLPIVDPDSIQIALDRLPSRYPTWT